MLETYLIAVAVGVCAEVTARLGRLWLYRRPLHPVINVLLMFGVVQGLFLASLVPLLGAIPVFLAGWAVGYGYELLNFHRLGWWHFPEDRFLFFKGNQACAMSVGALWGGVPIAVHFLAACFR
jgi:hypothetical protein